MSYYSWLVGTLQFPETEESDIAHRVFRKEEGISFLFSSFDLKAVLSPKKTNSSMVIGLDKIYAWLYNEKFELSEFLVMQKYCRPGP